MSPRELKLAAMDADDLSVLSAHVQDAVLKVSEVKWMQATGHLVVPMNRFAWERTKAFGRGSNERRRAVLQFDRVRSVQAVGVTPEDKDRVLSLLALVFDAGDPPAGAISLVCSGDTVLRLEVECIEARLTDLGPAWSASMRPKHAVR